MEKIHKVGRFYTRIIMKHIGIFIFVGMLFVVFHDHGWLPNEDIYAISRLVYTIILPVLIAFEGGRLISEEEGGILAVLIMSGILVSESSAGILGAMLAGPIAGILRKYEQRILEEKAGSSVQMLTKNLTLGITGAGLAILSYYLISPVLHVVTEAVYRGVDVLVSCRMIALAGCIIEPAKVFFLNNVVNHAVLVPLGMEQIQDVGHSVLFLLETNPGPGLGLLLALFYKQKERRTEYVTAMIAQTIGGIHEIYFPFVLSDLKLLMPLILGGVAGDMCFVLLDAGVQGAISPGSILIILLMAGKDEIIPVLAGIGISVAVTFAGCLVVMRNDGKKVKESNTERNREMKAEMLSEHAQEKEQKEKVERLAFVCEGGVGSSAMGAAMFRRVLGRKGIEEVRAEAYAADLIPNEVQMIICQKDYYERLPGTLKGKEIYTVESLLKTEEYEELAEIIRKRNIGIG